MIRKIIFPKDLSGQFYIAEHFSGTKPEADSIGVTRATVQRWESGVIKNMKLDKIDSLARVLQFAPSEIYMDPESAEYMKDGPSRPQMTPQQEILLDAAKDLTPKELDAVLAMIQALKMTR